MNVSLIRKWLLPAGYEILPIPVIVELINAGECLYGPAVGGQDSYAWDRIKNATRAAENVLARERKRNRR